MRELTKSTINMPSQAPAMSPGKLLLRPLQEGERVVGTLKEIAEDNGRYRIFVQAGRVGHILAVSDPKRLRVGQSIELANQGGKITLNPDYGLEQSRGR